MSTRSKRLILAKGRSERVQREPTRSWGSFGVEERVLCKTKGQSPYGFPKRLRKLRLLINYISNEKKMVLEIITLNLDDVKKANKSKADRLEFCNNIEVGGLTPKMEDIIEVVNYSKLPVNVGVRFTYEDFFFSEEERKLQIDTIAQIAKTKANGVVIGTLTKDFKVDEEFLQEVNKVRGNLDITFHRAFDLVEDKVEGMKALERCNVTNVLTSGNNILEESFEVLEQITSLKSSVKLLIGGGVRKEYLERCLQISDNIHIGTAARNNLKYEDGISFENVEYFKEMGEKF
ncbi:hypothetical protein FQR65_LT19254 [Abscondita terminalis]|nr:hypothetical protein FQR65_LT19254 [Abscondita terminalis]